MSVSLGSAVSPVRLLSLCCFALLGATSLRDMSFLAAMVADTLTETAFVGVVSASATIALGSFAAENLSSSLLNWMVGDIIHPGRIHFF